jgi:hypothetical protein
MRDKSYSSDIYQILMLLLLAAAVLTALGYLVFSLIPGISPEQSSRLTADFIPRIRGLSYPEPRERNTFFVLVLLTPAICFGVVWLCTKLRCSCSGRLLPDLGLAFIPVLLLTTCLAYDPQYCNNLFTPVMDSAIRFAALLGLTVAAACFIPKINIKHSWHQALWALLLCLPLLQVFCCRIYTLDRLVNEYDDHINIVSYAIAQAVGGLNDYHYYGFYCRIIAPLMRFTGAGVFNISIIMGILFVTAIYCIYRTAFQMMRNRLLVLGFALLIFYLFGMSVFLHRHTTFKIDPYFAYFPIRLFWPGVALLCYYRLLADKRKYWLPLYGVISGIALLWNLDSGVALTGAAGAALFAELIFSKEKQAVLRRIVVFAGSALVTLLTVFGLIWLDCGDVPPVLTMLEYLGIFYRGGFTMLPMPAPPAAWCAVAGIYLLGLIVGIRQFMAKDFGIMAKMSIYLSVLGIGLFAYYQGRSHILNLPSVSWPAALLLFLYSDRLARLLRANLIDHKLKLLLLPVMFVTLGAAATFIFDLPRIGAGINRTVAGIAAMQQINPMEDNVRFILANAGDHKEVNILSDMQGVYYAETGLRAGIKNFGVVEQLLISERERTLKELKQARIPLFISVFAGERDKVPAWIYQHYQLVNSNSSGSMLLFLPR